jgi:hypothetical protein
VLDDDGYFILAAYFNGIAHPPGYPLYTLLAHFATWVPLGSVAFRVHLLSAFFAALACSCLWYITRILIKERSYAYVAALGLAFSREFWSRAIISKTYTLNVFIILLAFFCAYDISRQDDEREVLRRMKYLFLCYGFGLGNHWPLVILSTPMLIALIWPRIGICRKYIHICLPYLLPGLALYAWMFVRSQMNPEISFYGPLDNLSDLWFYVSRQGYADIDVSPSADWHDKLYFIADVIPKVVEQYGLVGFLPVLAGVVYQRRILPTHIVLALILGFLGPTVCLILLLGFDYDRLHEVVFSFYPLPAYAITSLWMGIGIYAVVVTLKKYKVIHEHGKAMVAGLVLLVAGTTLAHNIAYNYRAHDDWARTFAKSVLDSLPPDSIMFLADDVNVGPIGYLNKVEGYRSDIEIYHVKGQVFRNRLYRPFKVNYQDVRKEVDRFIKSHANREIYYSNSLLHSYGTGMYGLYYKVIPEFRAGHNEAVLNPQLLEYWAFLLKRGKPWDPWEQIHYKSIFIGGCALFNHLEHTLRENENYQQLQAIHSKLCNNLSGSYVTIDSILQEGKPDWNRIRSLLKKADTQLDDAVLKSELSSLDYYRGIVFMHDKDYDGARSAFFQSINKWNHPENPSWQKLQELQ